MEDLQKQGILPMASSGDYDADADGDDTDIPELTDRAATQQDDDEDEVEETDEDQPFVSFIDRMRAEKKRYRRSIKEMHRKRSSIEDLKAKGIYKERTTDPASTDLESKPQVYMSDEYANSLNKRRGSKKDMDIGRSNDSQDEYPVADDVDSSDSQDDVYTTFIDRMRERKGTVNKTVRANIVEDHVNKK